MRLAALFVVIVCVLSGIALATLISGINKSQEQLRESQERLQERLTSTTEATTNANQLIIYHHPTEQELFRLGPGGCLRGPLSVKDITGKNVFILAAGADYPPGCSDKK